jgi:hypothetical protein
MGNADDNVVQDFAKAQEISPARVEVTLAQPAYVHVPRDDPYKKSAFAPAARPRRTHVSPPPRHPAQRPDRPRRTQASPPPRHPGQQRPDRPRCAGFQKSPSARQPPLPPPASATDNGAQGIGWPSLGSVGHPKSCAMGCKYHSKAKGCKDGFLCKCCHLCAWRRFQVKREQKVDPMYLTFLEAMACNNGMHTTLPGDNVFL